MSKTKSNHEGGVATQIDHSTEIIDALKKAYGMELETVLNYIANSINLDGVRANEIRDSLKDDVKEETDHARKLGHRIKILGGIVPGSQALQMSQRSLQPKQDTADVVSVIRGVIEAEDAACMQYQKIIELCDGVDWVTQDMCIGIMGEEEEHRREFQGFLKEYERGH
jgi:bacterioferritin